VLLLQKRMSRNFQLQYSRGGKEGKLIFNELEAYRCIKGKEVVNINCKTSFWPENFTESLDRC
jgi:hypothetical protein